MTISKGPLDPQSICSLIKWAVFELCASFECRFANDSHRSRDCNTNQRAAAGESRSSDLSQCWANLRINCTNMRMGFEVRYSESFDIHWQNNLADQTEECHNLPPSAVVRTIAWTLKCWFIFSWATRIALRGQPTNTDQNQRLSALVPIVRLSSAWIAQKRVLK
jgi:hypothetical protein